MYIVFLIIFSIFLAVPNYIKFSINNNKDLKRANLILEKIENLEAVLKKYNIESIPDLINKDIMILSKIIVNNNEITEDELRVFNKIHIEINNIDNFNCSENAKFSEEDCEIYNTKKSKIFFFNIINNKIKFKTDIITAKYIKNRNFENLYVEKEDAQYVDFFLIRETDSMLKKKIDRLKLEKEKKVFDNYIFNNEYINALRQLKSIEKIDNEIALMKIHKLLKENKIDQKNLNMYKQKYIELYVSNKSNLQNKYKLNLDNFDGVDFNFLSKKLSLSEDNIKKELN